MRNRRMILGLLLGGLCCLSFAGKSLENKGVSAYYEDTHYAIETGKNEELSVQAKSAYLMDFSTQTPIFAKNETQRLPIASMCKIMTLLLAFEAIDSGAMELNETIMVSEKAASMGGSQVFLEANAKYLVTDLLKSIVVCSANDSCVAIAERIAGDERIFVERMNAKAKELGAHDTLFANCTGLPKEPQYSCAKDVATMLKSLLKHDKYYEYGSVWMDKFAHPQGRFTEITNTNKLVRFYDGCDGGKTGFTNEAGFCLAATAKRQEMRIISVVIGEETSQTRFNDVRTMFDYAFANYTVAPIVKSGAIYQEKVEVDGGKEKYVSVYPAKSVYAFMRRGEKPNITLESKLINVKAPVAKDESIGELIIYQDGVELDRVELLSDRIVKKANLFDRLQEIGEKWTGR